MTVLWTISHWIVLRKYARTLGAWSPRKSPREPEERAIRWSADLRRWQQLAHIDFLGEVIEELNVEICARMGQEIEGENRPLEEAVQRQGTIPGIGEGTRE